MIGSLAVGNAFQKSVYANLLDIADENLNKQRSIAQASVAFLLSLVQWVA